MRRKYGQNKQTGYFESIDLQREKYHASVAQERIVFIVASGRQKLGRVNFGKQFLVRFVETSG